MCGLRIRLADLIGKTRADGADVSDQCTPNTSHALRAVYDDAQASLAVLTAKDGTVIFRIPASTLLLTVFLAQAQPASNRERFSAIPHATMRSILRDMRLEFTEKPSDDSTAFDFQLNGHKVRLLNEVQNMKLSACTDASVDLLKMNQWNRQHFSTGARLDEHGCASLVAEMSFAGGLTRTMIEDYIREFGTVVTVYARFMAGLPRGTNTPALATATVVQPEVARSPIDTMAWTQAGSDTGDTPPGPSPTQSVAGLLKINDNITLRYNAAKWKPTPSHEAGQFTLIHSSGAHALVIAERIAVPLDALQDVALANAQVADPNAKIVFRNRLRVNGVPVWFVKIEAEFDTVPTVYWGYYYANQSITVQVVAYTTKTLMPASENDMMELLNGLAVSGTSGRDVR